MHNKTTAQAQILPTMNTKTQTQTRTKPRTRTEIILAVMHIIAWLVFIGFAIEAGAILISYGVSTVNPEGAKNLYKGANLYSLRQYSFWQYTQYVFYMAGGPVLKAFICYQVIKTIMGINLAAPFRMEILRRLELISYTLFGAFILSLLNTVHADWLLKTTGVQYPVTDFGGSLFAAGLVFVIAQIFRRGVEMQSENELTV